MIERRPGYNNQMMVQHCQSLLNVLNQTEKKTVGSGKNKKEITIPKYKDAKEKLTEIMQSCEYYNNLKDSIQLRPYQQEIVERGFGILNKYRFLYLAMEVRTGKTLTSLSLADKMGASNVLFVTKKKAISSIQADFDKLNPSYQVTIINYESLHHVDDNFDLIICDEAHSCFLGNTLVDGKKIKDIKLGDYLNSFNFANNIYEKKKVINIYKNRLNEDLIKIRCNGKEIVCTKNHEIFTKRGWIKAGELLSTDELQILQ
jgi:hypothetical protein